MTKTYDIIRRMTPISESDSEFFRDLGQRIAQARKDAGLTQLQLAEALGISQPVLGSYEIGRRRLPASMLQPVVQTLNISIDKLLGHEQPAANSKRGPAPKLQRQIEAVGRLPRARQKFVSDFLDTVLQSEQTA